MSAGTDPATAARNWYTPHYYTGTAKWTMTATDKLLFDAGYSTNVEIYTNHSVDPTIPKSAAQPAWYATPVKTRFGSGHVLVCLLPIRRPVPSATPFRRRRHTVTGRTISKAACSEPGVRSTTPRIGMPISSSAIAAACRTASLVYNTPRWWQGRLNYDTGFYIQDSWTIKRLTVNPGLRWELMDGQNTGTVSGAGRFVPERRTETVKNLPHWNDIAPRFGAVYDLFGNAKTALKFTRSKYNGANTTGFADNYNSLSSTATANLPWTDFNKDDIAQGELGCTLERPVARSTSRRFRWDSAASPRCRHPTRISIRLQHRNQRGGAARADAEGVGQRPVVSPRVPQSDGDRLHLPQSERLLRRERCEPARRRGDHGLQHQRGGVDAGRTRGLRQLEASADLRRLRVGVCDATARWRPVVRRHDHAAHLQRQLRSAGRPQPDPILRRPRPADPFTTQLKFAGSYEFPWGYPDERLAAKRAWPAAPDQLEYRQNHALRGRLQGAVYAWRAGDSEFERYALVVPLIPPGYEFMDRFNQFDLKFAKLFRVKTAYGSRGSSKYSTP